MRARFREKKVDRDWLNTNFPCMMACPAQTNAGRYVAAIADGKFEEAYRYARDPNPMASICGRVCAHPCETACRRGAIDKPISIRALKRFLTERYGPESRHPLEATRRAAQKLPSKVAIIGSGPVGLSAAHDLALLGYSVTIFEAAPVAGGMLCLGIPEYRLPRSVVEAQVREILDLGGIGNLPKLNSGAFVLAMLLLVIIGMSSTAYTTTSLTAVQMLSSDEYRGLNRYSGRRCEVLLTLLSARCG
jgi:hypothetical protein